MSAPEETKFTPGPWRWQGEDYRGGWGWQMLVGPNGEGLIVGQDKGGGICKHLRAHQPLDASLCVTGMMASGKEHAESVHVFGEATARLIAAGPELYEALNALLEEHVDMLKSGDYGTSGDVETFSEVKAARTALAKARGEFA